MTTWRRDVSLVLVLLLLGAIWFVVEQWRGEGKSGDTSIAAHRATCQLLTRAEIQHALGAASGPGRAIDDGDSCFWQVGNTAYTPERGEFIGVRLDVVSPATYDDYGAEIGTSGGETVRAIRVGSAEGLLRFIDKQRFVLARSGRHVLQVQASTSPSGPWRVEAAVKLTRLALTRVDA